MSTYLSPIALGFVYEACQSQNPGLRCPLALSRKDEVDHASERCSRLSLCCVLSEV